LASVVDVRPIKSDKVIDINVGGTCNVLLAATACKETQAFVYCSTLDVVYTGRPMDFVQETLPYTTAKNFRWWVPGNYYAPSKARAEEMVLAANSEDTKALKTCALRPGHLFGERDAILDFFVRLPATFSSEGRMTMQYIGNTASLHILAARELLRENNQVCGEAFNIGDRDISFSEFYGRVLQPTHEGHRPPRLLPIPYLVLFVIGLSMDVLDFFLWMLGQFLTPFAMCLRCKNRGDHVVLRFPRHPALCLCSASALERCVVGWVVGWLVGWCLFVSISYRLTSCHHHLLFFLLPPSGLSLLLLLLFFFFFSLQFRTPSHQFIQRPPCVQVPRHVWQNNLRPSNFCGVERCRCQDQTLDAKQNGESTKPSDDRV